MKTINETELKNTLKKTVEEHSSSLDFFAGFDDSKPELGFDRSEIKDIAHDEAQLDQAEKTEEVNDYLTPKTSTKKRFKKYQFVAVAACLVLVTFSAIAIGFDFGSLISNKSTQDMASGSIDVGIASEEMVEETSGIMDTFSSDSLEPDNKTVESESSELVLGSAPESIEEPAPEPIVGSAPESIYEPAPESIMGSAPGSIYEPAPESIMGSAPESIYEPAPGSISEGSAEPASDGSSKSAAGVTDERETRTTDSANMARSEDTSAKSTSDDQSESLTGGADHPESAIVEKEATDSGTVNGDTPSPGLTILLFVVAGLITFMLTFARKHEDSSLHILYSNKSLKWVCVIIAGASIIAAIVLYTIYIL